MAGAQAGDSKSDLPRFAPKVRVFLSFPQFTFITCCCCYYYVIHFIA